MRTLANHLPEFLRLGLAVDTTMEASLSLAIRAASEALCQHSLSRHALLPSLEPDDILMGLGFAISSLDASERRALWEHHSRLIEGTSRPEGIAELARFYLGEVAVTVGHPFAGTRFNLARSGSRVRLSDKSRPEQVIWITADNEPSPGRLVDLETTLSALAPRALRSLITWKDRVSAHNPHFTTTERRLSCPTFLR